MLGVVLCGGQSSRMGRDKGLIKREGVSWADIAMEKLTGLGIPAKLSVNANQFPAYADVFGVESLIVDNVSIKVSGPLLGLMSVNDMYPGEDLFLIACDMPDLQVSLLSNLQSRYQQFPGSDAYVYTNKEMIEPLCGIYCTGAVRRIHKMYNEGALPGFSMRNVLGALKTDLIAIMPEQEFQFNNMNTPADI
jgi:molybdenum cofactor guanylyltransferase